MVIIVVGIVMLNYAISLVLFNIDTRKNGEEQKVQSNRWCLSKSAWIYAGIMSLLTVGMAIWMQMIYIDNSFLFSLKRLLLLGILWPVAYIDFKTYRIPNLFIIYGLVTRIILLVFELLFERENLLSTVIAEGVAALALVVAALLCTLIIKNSVGFGDIKLFAIMGLYLGLAGIWSAVFVSMVISFLLSVMLLLTKKKKRKDMIPFGPSIVIGTYLSVFLTGM